MQRFVTRLISLAITAALAACVSANNLYLAAAGRIWQLNGSQDFLCARRVYNEWSCRFRSGDQAYVMAFNEDYGNALSQALGPSCPERCDLEQLPDLSGVCNETSVSCVTYLLKENGNGFQKIRLEESRYHSGSYSTSYYRPTYDSSYPSYRYQSYRSDGCYPPARPIEVEITLPRFLTPPGCHHDRHRDCDYHRDYDRHQSSCTSTRRSYAGRRR